MTFPPPQRNRAHNLRIVGTISNDTASLDWEPIESNPSSWLPRPTLYSAGFLPPLPQRRSLSLLQFPANQYQEFIEAESKGRYFLSHVRNRFPYQKLPR